MPFAGFVLDGRETPTAEALAGAKAGQGEYPYALLSLLADQRNDETPSATALIGCLRAFELKRTQAYYLDPTKLLAAINGTALHAALEGKAHGGTQEARLWATFDFPDLPAPFDRVAFGGQPDSVDPPVILDWKIKSYLSQKHEAQPEHVRQVNIYGWLYYVNHGVRLTDWHICYIGPTSKAKPVNRRGKLADPAVVGAWVGKRVYQWAQAASLDVLPPPLPTVHETDPKKQGHCRWCDVRAHCQAALERGE